MYIYIYIYIKYKIIWVGIFHLCLYMYVSVCTYTYIIYVLFGKPTWLLNMANLQLIHPLKEVCNFFTFAVVKVYGKAWPSVPTTILDSSRVNMYKKMWKTMVFVWKHFFYIYVNLYPRVYGYANPNERNFMTIPQYGKVQQDFII